MLKLVERVHSYGTILKTIIRNACGIKLDPEVHILNRFISAGSICFDIGAAYGRYALTMSRLAGRSGRVYCFEPAEHSHRVLSKIVKFYHLENVAIVKKAFSDQEGTGNLALPIKRNSKVSPGLAHSLAHLVTDSDTNYMSNAITLTTMDRYASKVNISRLDFIKCDVEGAELLVFEGGRNTIERFKPVVLCEIYKTWLKRFATIPEHVHEFFRKLGYSAFALTNGELREVKTIKEDRNFFFIPSQVSKTNNFQKQRTAESDTTHRDKAEKF